MRLGVGFLIAAVTKPEMILFLVGDRLFGGRKEVYNAQKRIEM